MHLHQACAWCLPLCIDRRFGRRSPQLLALAVSRATLPCWCPCWAFWPERRRSRCGASAKAPASLWFDSGVCARLWPCAKGWRISVSSPR